jgi:TonB family protein
MEKLSSAILVAVLLSLAGCATVANRQPTIVTRCDPAYPYELKYHLVTGKVDLEYVVDTDGNVGQVRVLKATNEEFGQAATACILKWKFTPMIVDGHPVNAKLRQSFFFDIQDD